MNIGATKVHDWHSNAGPHCRMTVVTFKDPGCVRPIAVITMLLPAESKRAAEHDLPQKADAVRDASIGIAAHKDQDAEQAVFYDAATGKLFVRRVNVSSLSQMTVPAPSILPSTPRLPVDVDAASIR